MNKSLIIATACLIGAAGIWGMGFMSGASFEQDRAIKAAAKQADRQARADAQAVEDARDKSNEIDQGLVTDARKTDTAVTGAKARLHALKPPVVAPAPQCGPSAYVISVEGASPDDVWRAYVDGRNSVFQAASSGSASSVHSVNSDAIVSSSAAQSE